MIRLATRLTTGGGREALVRLLLTAVGMAAAVTMLLGAAVAFPALHAHDVRRAWTETSEQNRQPAQDESTTDPLLWKLTVGRYDGRDLLRVDVSAAGPDAPVPPGLDRLPAPGEIAVSPDLQELLATTDPAELGDRFPGEIVATIGRDGLASPEDLVVFVGRSATELQAETDVLTVRSIESAPISRNLTRQMRIVFVVGGMGLLVPIVIFVATATRLAAARREQRLASLRLAGATQEQVGVVAAVEAAMAGIAGTVVGFLTFFAIRPSLARIPFDGASFYPSDMRLSLGWAAAIAVGVPLLAVAAALISLRRIRISPLGVARRATRSRPTPWALLMVALGMAGLTMAVVWANQNGDINDTVVAIAIAVPFVAMVVGIVLSGPWLTALVARGINRFGRGAPSLLAARRLQDNPAAGFRAISGITLAVFVGTVFSGLASSMLAAEDIGGTGLGRDVVVDAPEPELPDLKIGPEVSRDASPASADLPLWPELDPAATAQLVDDLRGISGVEEVVTAHVFPDDADLFEGLIRSGSELRAPVLVSCEDAVAMGFEGCDGATVLNVTRFDIAPTGFSAQVPLDDLRVVGLAAVTDGNPSAVERARTQLELGMPGTRALTSRDIDTEARSELDTMQRISNVGLSLTLVIAGCSLAVAVAGALVERKQPFALLRLAGTRLSELRRVVMAEAVAPLLMVAGASVGLGLLVAYLILEAGGAHQAFVMPGPSYWLSLLGGLGVALLVVMATLPLLDRLTDLDSARFE